MEIKRVTIYSHANTLDQMLMSGGNLERLERKGGVELAASDQMPAKILSTQTLTPAQHYELLGFTVPDQQDTTDPLFIDAILPTGWHKEVAAADPSGRTVYVFDEKNRKRIVMWYKAMPYDRAASAEILMNYEDKD